jgi:hypothetical protein
MSALQVRKIDRYTIYPGRLNQVSVLINREGTFYVQLWYFTQFNANSCRISFNRKITYMTRRTIVGYSLNSSFIVLGYTN